jgi:hypothetical protein
MVRRAKARRLHSESKNRLLPDLIELACGLEQVELRLLTLEIRLEVEHPLFVFFQPGAFYFAQIDLSLVELRLQDGDVLLGKLQLESRDIFGGVSLAQVARFLAHCGAYFVFLVGKVGLGDVEIDFRQCDAGFGLRAEDGNLHLHTGV